jgi:hypothetical protein
MADDLVLLGVTTEIEARIWRDALAQEAVPVLIRSADPLGPAGYAPMLGDVQVYVRAGDERRARWIIGEAIEPNPAPFETPVE